MRLSGTRILREETVKQLTGAELRVQSEMCELLGIDEEGRTYKGIRSNSAEFPDFVTTLV